MDFFKFKGQVIKINGHEIDIKVEDEKAFADLLAGLKIWDKIDVVISKPQIEDLQEYVREFNKTFSR